MEVFGGIVGISHLLLTLIIGIRLLRLSRRLPEGPEIWLALYFLVAAFLGMGLSYLVYMSWADAALKLPAQMEIVLHAVYLFGTTSGMACLYVFTWRTFRADELWARLLVLAVVVTMVAGYVGIGFLDGFRIRLIPSFAHWITWAARTSVFLWLFIESFRYWRLLRRRLRLGLADPLVANRFLLWSIFAGATLLTGLIDPLSRVWYITLAGGGEVWTPEVGRPIVLAMVPLSSALNMLVMVTLYLTFFPTRGFRRWIETRSASA